ncbi:unnamed protein product [Ceutorhynchus assimilis]|uniref:Uncharacterized protein n=1 Tax=Ceutorhynchus assimilis TaxID=467358 RepID=A0A9N9MRN1_9CUCU|nr:unnamed protein product [Ceutorhynchus assimilis]
MNKITANNMFKLSSTVIYGQLFSRPAFSIDIFLAIMFGAIQCLLIYEITTLEWRTSARVDSMMEVKQSFKDYPNPIVKKTSVKKKSISTCTSDRPSPVTVEKSSERQKKPIETCSSVRCYTTLFKPVPQIHHRSDIHHGLSRAKSISHVKFDKVDRLQYLLSVSPSEYVRRDREWMQNKKHKLITCIRTLAKDLEQAVSEESLNTQKMYKNAIQNSIKTLKRNFVSQLNSSYRLDNFASTNFQPLLEQYGDGLRSSLSNDLIMAICHNSNTTNVSRSCGDGDDEETTCKSEYDYDMEIVSSTLSFRSSESFIEVLKKRSRELFVNFNYK